MKILIISDAWHPQVNGVVRTYEYLATYLKKYEHDVHVIGPADFPYTWPLPGYAEIKMALFPYKRLKHMIKDFAPDTIHIATEGTLGWAARRYCLKNGVKYTSCYHTHFPDYVAKRIAKILPFFYKPTHRITRAFVHKFHKPSSTLFLATNSLEHTLKSWGFSMPMARLLRGVDLSLFSTATQSTQIQHDKPVALYVGRIAIEKNLEAFLDMNWTGTKVLVGDGPDLSMLKARYPDAVFTGKKTGQDLVEQYRAADIFVFPSKTDTFGIVLIEALAMGLPIAAYPVTGPVDIVTDNILGALHEDLSVAATKALELSADSDNTEKRIEHVKSTYTWDAVARQFIDAVHKAEKT